MSQNSLQFCSSLSFFKSFSPCIPFWRISMTVLSSSLFLFFFFFYAVSSAVNPLYHIVFNLGCCRFSREQLSVGFLLISQPFAPGQVQRWPLAWPSASTHTPSTLCSPCPTAVCFFLAMWKFLCWLPLHFEENSSHGLQGFHSVASTRSFLPKPLNAPHPDHWHTGPLFLPKAHPTGSSHL